MGNGGDWKRRSERACSRARTRTGIERRTRSREARIGGDVALRSCENTVSPSENESTNPQKTHLFAESLPPMPVRSNPHGARYEPSGVRMAPRKIMPTLPDVVSKIRMTETKKRNAYWLTPFLAPSSRAATLDGARCEACGVVGEMTPRSSRRCRRRQARCGL